jgi:signal transduction histidine kinase
VLERVARLSPSLRALLAAIAAAGAVLAERSGGPLGPLAAADLTAGLALLAGAVVAGAQARGTAAAALLLVTAGAWFAGDVDARLLYAHRGPLVQLLLAYPSARVRPRALVALVALAYVDGLVPDLARSTALTVALFAAVIVAAAWRHRSAAGVARRARGAALIATLLIAGTLVAASLLDASAAAAVWAFDLAVAVGALGLAADLRWGAWTGAAITGMVVELGGRHEPLALRATLARVLGDPGLEISYRVAADGSWRDETGAPVAEPRAWGGRAVTLVRDGGEPVAALVHDPAALADRELAAPVAAAVRLAVANARMQAEIAERVLEVGRSRQRLVEASDQERQDLHEELRRSAEHRLAEISRRLTELARNVDGDATEALGQLSAELDEARAELGDLARGIYPRALTERGLHAALVELAAHSAVPVSVDVPDRRFSRAYEAAAYFVCSEGLANVAKYAHASRARVAVAAGASELLVTVEDDGAGGADAARGSGLRGLADRVEALGGALRVDSPRGSGTRLEARLPLAGSGDR